MLAVQTGDAQIGRRPSAANAGTASIGSSAMLCQKVSLSLGKMTYEMNSCFRKLNTEVLELIFLQESRR